MPFIPTTGVCNAMDEEALHSAGQVHDCGGISADPAQGNCASESKALNSEGCNYSWQGHLAAIDDYYDKCGQLYMNGAVEHHEASQLLEGAVKSDNNNTAAAVFLLDDNDLSDFEEQYFPSVISLGRGNNLELFLSSGTIVLTYLVQRII